MRPVLVMMMRNSIQWETIKKNNYNLADISLKTTNAILRGIDVLFTIFNGYKERKSGGNSDECMEIAFHILTKAAPISINVSGTIDPLHTMVDSW